jgi:hypothetical protein
LGKLFLLLTHDAVMKLRCIDNKNGAKVTRGESKKEVSSYGVNLGLDYQNKSSYLSPM